MARSTRVRQPLTPTELTATWVLSVSSIAVAAAVGIREGLNAALVVACLVAPTLSGAAAYVVARWAPAKPVFVAGVGLFTIALWFGLFVLVTDWPLIEVTLLATFMGLGAAALSLVLVWVKGRS